MLETQQQQQGESGELPLMKQVTTLKRVGSLRDPATGPNTVGSLSTVTPGWKAAEMHARKPLGAKKGSTLTHRSCHREHNSDLQHASYFVNDTVNVECQSRITNRQNKFTLSNQCEELLIKNWRDPPWDFHNMESSSARCQSAQDCNGAQTINHRSLDCLIHAHPCNCSHKTDAMRYELERKESGARTKAERSRCRKKALGRTECPQVLSPLVLNSLDNNNFVNGNCVYRATSRDKPKSPQFLNHPFAIPKRDSAKQNWKNEHVLPSSTNTSHGTLSPNSLSGTWEDSSNKIVDEFDMTELPNNNCGIPCYYWSKNNKKGKSLERVSYSGLYQKPHVSLAYASKKHYHSGSNETGGHNAQTQKSRFKSEALPLLSEASGFSDNVAESTGEDSDGFSGEMNGELALDAGSTFPERKNVKQDTAQVLCNTSRELTIYVERPRSLSQKYRPKSFDDLVGQNLVVHALSNAVLQRKVAPLYLFQGPRGTGKTSTARIFAAALNCVSSEGERPCGCCKECAAFSSGKSSDIQELDAASNSGMERVKALLKSGLPSRPFSRFKVFIVDECHALTSETMNALLKLLEEPPRNVVFIFITTDFDKLPATAVSRCQKFLFFKIKESEIVNRLRTLARLENLDIEAGALELVASRSDGSLRDAEIVLDQLSLIGQKITMTTVYELFGLVSEEKLMDLLQSALSSDTVHTVQKARELINSGVEPLDLMVQLASLITDILAGSTKMANGVQNVGCFSRERLMEEDYERLRLALRILSDAEKQLRSSTNERMTWLTAALLQFGPARIPVLTASSSGRSHTASPVVGKLCCNDDEQVLQPINKKKIAFKSNIPVLPKNKINPGDLELLWWNVLQRCKSSSTRQLLQCHAKLSEVSVGEDNAVVLLEFRSSDIKARGESCKENLSDVFRLVLGVPVEIKFSFVSSTKQSTQDLRVHYTAHDLELLHRNHGKLETHHRQSKWSKMGSIHQKITESPPASPVTVANFDATNDGTGSNIVTEFGCEIKRSWGDPIAHNVGSMPAAFIENTGTSIGASHAMPYEAADALQMDHNACNIEQENLRLESQPKYGFLCWRGHRREDEKMPKTDPAKRRTGLRRLVPCAVPET